MNKTPHILNIDKGRAFATKLEQALALGESSIDIVPDFPNCINQFLIEPPDIVLAGRFTLEHPPLSLLHRLKQLKQSLVVFVLLEKENMKTAIDCMKAGAENVFLKTDIDAISRAVSEFLTENNELKQNRINGFPSDEFDDACAHAATGATCRLSCFPDGSLKMEYVSESLWDLIGHAPQDGGFQLELLYNAIHPDDRSYYDVQPPKLSDDLSPISYDVRVITADGHVKWIRENNFFLKESNGNVIVEKYLADITKCRKIEKQLNHYKQLLKRQEAEETLRYEHFEAEHRQREAYYLTLFEYFSDVVTVFDRSTIITYESSAISNVLGYSKEERLGKSALELIHPDDFQRLNPFFLNHIERPGEIPYFEYRAHRKDGQWRYFEGKGANLLHDPIINGVLVVSRDITLRKQAEQKQKASEQLFRSLFASAAAPLCLVDAQGYFVDANPTCCRLFGYAPKALKGQFFTSLLADEQRDIAVLAFKTFVHTSIYKSTEQWVGKAKDGRRLELNTSAALFSDYDGKRFIILSFEDITELNCAIRELTEIKQQLEVQVEERTREIRLTNQLLHEQIAEKEKAENHLKQNEEFFRLSFTESPVATAIVDLSFKLLKVNRAFLDMMGYSEVEQSAFRFYDFLHSEDFSRYREQINALKQDANKHFTFDARYNRKDGQPLWGYTAIGLIKDNNQHPLYYLVQVQDISERKASQEALSRKNTLLRGVADGTKRLLSIAEPEVAVQKCLQNMGEALDIERVHLMQQRLNVSRNNYRLTLRCEWTRSGILSQDELVENGFISPGITSKIFSKENFDWESLISGEPVATLSRELPPKQKQFLESMGIKSVLLVPIMVETGFWGVIGFDEHKYERIWSPDEESILIAAASSIGTALSRAAALKELQASKDRYRTLAQNFPKGALALFDKDLTPMIIGGEAFLGYDNIQEVVAGKNFREIWPSEVSRELEKSLNQAFAGKKNSIELHYREKDWQIWAVPNFDTQKDEQIETITAICLDITEQKNEQRLLLESERNYRGFFQNVHDAILVCSTSDEILAINQRACEMYDYKESELLSERIDMLCKYPAHGRVHLNEVLRYGEVASFQAIHIKKDGSELHVEMNSTTGTYKGRKAIISVCRDVTDKKVAEQALREIELRNRRIIDTAAEGIWIVDEHRITTFVNRQMADLLGYEEKDMLGKSLERFLDPKQNIEGLFELAQKKSGKTSCDIKLLKQSGQTLWAMVSASRMVKEDSKATSLLMMISDITERKQIEEELQRRKRYYQTLTENLPRGAALIIDKNYQCVLAAGNAFNKKGGDRPRTEGRMTDDVKPIHLADRLKSYYENAFQGEKLNFLFDYLKRTWQVYIVPNVSAEDDAIDTISVIAYDISEYKKQEKALIESESRFRDIFNISPFGMLLASSDGKIQLVNSTFEKMLGYSQAELYQKSEADLTHAEDIAKEALLSVGVKGAQEHSYDVEKRYIRKNQEIIWVKLTGKALPKTRKSSPLALGIVEDITERRRTRQELKKTLNEYSTLVKNFPDAIVMVIDPNYQCIQVNGNAVKSTSQLIGGHPSDNCEPALLEFLSERYAGAFSGEKQSFELHFLGHYWMVHAVPNTWNDSGEVTTVSVICIDISKRKKIEDALLRSRERYRTIVDQMNELVFRCLPDGKLVFVNDAFCNFFTHPRPDLHSTNFLNFVFEEDHQKFLENVLSLKQENATQIAEYRVLVNGSLHWQRASSSGIFNDSGILEEVQIVGYDVTERRQAEHALHESEERFRFLAENASDLIVHLSIKHESQAEVTYISPSCTNILGYSKDELKSMRLMDLVHPDDLTQFYQAYAAFIKEEEPPPPLLYRNKHKSGNYIWLETLVKPICDETGTVVCAVMASRDVTERKVAEMAIQASEERYRQAIQNSPNPIFSIDQEGQLHTWNSACEVTFGFPPNEILNQNWTSLLAKQEQKNFLFQKVENIFQSEKEIDQTEITYHNKRDQELCMVCLLYPLKNLSGKVEFCVFANTDISDRIKYERKLKASLEERETLLKEVHHRVKNNLQVISSLLHLQKTKLQDEQAIQIFIDSQNRIHSMALIHQHLYQSDDLNNVDFAAYIDRLLLQLEITYGNHSVEFKTNVENIKLSLDYAIPCGLLINEIIANSLKHAFHSIDCPGKICIEMFHVKPENNLKICIADNGSGFSESITFENAQTLGFKLIRSFVTQLNGTVDVCGSQGTQFNIAIPL